MQIAYTYRGKENQAFVSPITEDGKQRHAVLFDGNIATILPTQIVTSTPIWVQRVLPCESVLPHNLVQAIGEAIQSH